MEQHFITKAHKTKIKEAKKKKGSKFVGKGDEVKIVTRPKKKKQPRPPPSLPSPATDLFLDVKKEAENSVKDLVKKDDMDSTDDEEACALQQSHDLPNEAADDENEDAEDECESIDIEKRSETEGEFLYPPLMYTVYTTCS